MQPSVQRTTVRLPIALLKQARQIARQRHMTLTNLIESGLRLELRALETPLPSPEFPVCRISRQAAKTFAAGLPPTAATWSLGAWDEWEDTHPETPPR